jgi:hypothetical protein
MDKKSNQNDCRCQRTSCDCAANPARCTCGESCALQGRMHLREGLRLLDDQIAR